MSERKGCLQESTCDLELMLQRSLYLFILEIIFFVLDVVVTLIIPALARLR
jgi:hypothetical protein